jgi:anti-sigma B factor antagonist
MATSGSRLSIAAHDSGDVTVLALAGEMLLDDGDVLFRAEVDRQIARQRPKIVVDLCHVSFIDSAGMGMLVSRRRAAVQAGGDLKLLHVTGRCQRVISLMRLTSVFEMFEDEEAAIRSFDARPA